MNNKFKGWRTVFSFTFKQTTNGVGFKIVTFLVAFLLFGALIATNLLIAKPNKDDEQKSSPIENVFVLDSSGLQETNYKDFITQIDNQQFKHISFYTVDKNTEEYAVKYAESKSDKSIAVVISPKGSDYEMKALIPNNSVIGKDEAEALLGIMSSAFQSNKLLQAGLSQEQLMAVLKPSVVSFSTIGETPNEAVFVVKTIAPMLFSFILYFMLLVYSQNVCKSVSVEKTSKLMDTLLTSVHPYALIAGKVLANVVTALGQFILWIISAVAGLFVGNVIARQIYPGFENIAITLIKFLRDNIGESALSIPSILMAILILCLGFLFYCVLAGLVGATVSKPEETSNSQSYFNLLIFLSWVIPYTTAPSSNETLLTALRYIPFTAPFSVPADLVIGSVSLGQGLISIAILIVFSILVIRLAGKIYKGLVLYTGQKFSFKIIGNILKGK